jgi:hypothetical protein
MTKTFFNSFAWTAGLTVLTLGLALAVTTETGFAARGVNGNSSGTPGGGGACAGGACGSSVQPPPRHISFSERHTGGHCLNWIPVYDEAGDFLAESVISQCWR